MKILSWNCRGLGKPTVVLKCRKKALEHKLDIMFLMETWLVKEKGKHVWIKSGFDDGWEVPREGLGGGLILAWLPGHNLQIVFQSNHIIHIDLLDTKGNPLSITFIYGHPEHSKRGEVWQQHRNLKNIAHPNWLCIGDFNQILSKEEKFSFNQGSIVGADLFQQTISKLQICNLVATGQKFTWMNNRKEGEGFCDGETR